MLISGSCAESAGCFVVTFESEPADVHGRPEPAVRFDVPLQILELNLQDSLCC